MRQTAIYFSLFVIILLSIFFYKKIFNEDAIQSTSTILINSNEENSKTITALPQLNHPVASNTISSLQASSSQINSELSSKNNIQIRNQYFSNLTPQQTFDLISKHNHLPKIRSLSFEQLKGNHLGNGQDDDIKKLAESGDVMAMYEYANRLKRKMESDWVEASSSAEPIDTDQFIAQHQAVFNYYVKSAVGGYPVAALTLANLYLNEKINKPAEGLAWIIIAQSMGHPNFYPFCKVNTAECNDELFEEAGEIAQQYLTIYQFETVQ